METSDEEAACEFPLFEPTSEEVSHIFKTAKTVAVVGLSEKEDRDSNRVARYLLDNGFEVIPVNPAHEEILGLRAFGSLTEIGRPVDVVDIFRKPAAIPAIVEEAIEMGAKVIWMQVGLAHNESARKAVDKGLMVVMSKCIMREHKKWLLSPLAEP